MSTDATEHKEVEDTQGRRRGFSLWRLLGGLLRLALAIAIIGASAYVAYHWLSNPPKARRRPPRPEATLVEVQPVRVEKARAVVEAMGTVVPVRTIKLSARVSGQVVEVGPAFVPGGRFEAGERVLQIERADYEFTVAQREASLTKAMASLRLEMGQQSVAEREYELLGETAAPEDEDLLLRQPQLDSKRADIAAARASLEEARLNLLRTAVLAPFSAAVQDRSVDLGAYVAPGTPLATLVDTDTYWIEASVRVSDLQWIAIPRGGDASGSAARVYQEAAWGPGEFREAGVERLMTDLELGGRMARLLVAVEDPLDLREAPKQRRALILGSFVRVEIEGKAMEAVVEVPRTALHEGNEAWVMAADNTLDVRRVQTVWGKEDRVYVSDGLAAGERLIVSGLGAPVPGMLLRTADMASEETKSPRPDGAPARDGRPGGKARGGK